jgi:arylsulfatase A-like enzyme
MAIINDDFRRRVQDLLSIDRTIASLQRTLARTGQAKNTVFVFSSDNGFHLGEHTLRSGKLTAFDTDIEVPLVIAGPHIPAGTSNSDIVQNIDLAPTFEQIAGVRVPANVDGASIVPLLVSRSRPPWRSTALIEHHGLDFTAGDPDEQSLSQGNPPTYEAIRTTRFTYVRYHDDHQREYYDLRRDPFELDNTYHSLSPRRIAQLNARLTALKNCRSAAQCWAAGRPSRTG